jgi:hypothetical protein
MCGSEVLDVVNISARVYSYNPCRALHKDFKSLIHRTFEATARRSPRPLAMTTKSTTIG